MFIISVLFYRPCKYLAIFIWTCDKEVTVFSPERLLSC